MERHFNYEVDHRYAFIWKVMGLKPDRDGVTVTDDRFIATYGRAKVNTPRSNVAGAHITEDYRWWKAVGIRGSFVDDGLTLGSSTRRGVCVHFHDKINPVLPMRKHSAVTVTVEDAEGLVELLGESQPR
ncbi:MAG: hypothetical protein ACR2H3_12960 [Acidimicrobiales bacterium]